MEGAMTIGDNAIVGAGSAVIRDVPPDSIAVGTPGRIVGKRILPERVWHMGPYISHREALNQ
jgi:acetyltransferase-like isoleucine patch superfamily enzyme